MIVRFEQSAEEALAYIMLDNEELGHKILARLRMLQADPFPHLFRDITFESYEVQFLKKQGMDIRSLKCSEFLDFRVFYFVDEKAGLIIICEIVSRKVAFDANAPHIERIKDVYLKYFMRLEGTNTK